MLRGGHQPLPSPAPHGVSPAARPRDPLRVHIAMDERDSRHAGGGRGGARTAGELDGAGGSLQKAGSVRAFPRPPQVEGRLCPLLGGGLGVRGSLQTSLGTAAVRGSRPGWREREGVRARVAA